MYERPQTPKDLREALEISTVVIARYGEAWDKLWTRGNMNAKSVPGLGLSSYRKG